MAVVVVVVVAVAPVAIGLVLGAILVLFRIFVLVAVCHSDRRSGTRTHNTSSRTSRGLLQASCAPLCGLLAARGHPQETHRRPAGSPQKAPERPRRSLPEAVKALARPRRGPTKSAPNKNKNQAGEPATCEHAVRPLFGAPSWNSIGSWSRSSEFNQTCPASAKFGPASTGRDSSRRSGGGHPNPSVHNRALRPLPAPRGHTPPT